VSLARPLGKKRNQGKTQEERKGKEKGKVLCAVMKRIPPFCPAKDRKKRGKRGKERGGESN